MDETADLVRHVAAAVRAQDAQRLQFVERAAEHEVRDHERGVEREADEVAQVVLVHAAFREALVGVREDEAAELLDRLQHLAEVRIGERRAFDRGADSRPP